MQNLKINVLFSENTQLCPKHLALSFGYISELDILIAGLLFVGIRMQGNSRFDRDRYYRNTLLYSERVRIEITV